MTYGGIKLVEGTGFNNIKSAFDYFMENSKVTNFSLKTKGGIILKIELNNNVNSPFLYSRLKKMN
jgi:hypothetical protein